MKWCLLSLYSENYWKFNTNYYSSLSCRNNYIRKSLLLNSHHQCDGKNFNSINSGFMFYFYFKNLCDDNNLNLMLGLSYDAFEYWNGFL